LADVLATIIWVAVLVWLFDQTHYRDELRANFAGEPGVIDAMRYSPHLLQGGNYRTALFVWIWLPIVTGALGVAYIIARHRRSTQSKKDTR